MNLDERILRCINLRDSYKQKSWYWYAYWDAMINLLKEVHLENF
jgi:hypothetical protein